MLRATQFHSLAAVLRAASVASGPLVVQLGEMAFQPVDTDWVAERLADLALGPRPTAYLRATDLAGP